MQLDIIFKDVPEDIVGQQHRPYFPNSIFPASFTNISLTRLFFFCKKHFYKKMSVETQKP